MKNLFILLLFSASACVPQNSETVYPAPVAYVDRDILPPDLETASGGDDVDEDEVLVDSSEINNLYIDQPIEE